ncbi:hypothetical protein [Kitasatospora cheerisanensis]|uniref:Uncharacterized protein n=1 Tax=Kitasatospora cheerisanensis KCTC 2395 TaxID=1348663 RepID=A0A066YM49_9ACTN|nr:hypothetical protein [Kitasatospora cheerisanensis]KDN82197.1 hypothetical protein KCH_60310 [Kitasatospora cheerisanensis KCTC 2395]
MPRATEPRCGRAQFTGPSTTDRPAVGDTVRQSPRAMRARLLRCADVPGRGGSWRGGQVAVVRGRLGGLRLALLAASPAAKENLVLGVTRPEVAR